ncbi:MAG: hypothetical protein IJT12_03990 [Paludibacteraceae bacterium]|nr:hypothetical protein [Paludibacteraceae bacterium]
MPSPFHLIFTDILKTKLYPKTEWLSRLGNFDAFVKANTINLSEIGADPNVVKDNSTWPLTPVQRTDTGIAIPLATFDTVPTHITNVEELETSYDKVESAVQQHVNALKAAIGKSAAYNLAPATHAAATPLIQTSGAARGDGNKRLTFADVLALRTAFNKANLPMEDRVLLLSADHEADLMLEDANRYRAMMETGKIAGFDIYVCNQTPFYSIVSSVLTKSAATATTGLQSSVAFCAGETMRALGDIKGEPEERWADYRGWIFGAQVRFVGQPLRALGYGAIVDKAV